jgi:L-iditol 2-dehydrogenase
MNSATDTAHLSKRSYNIPKTMKAWVLGDPDQITLVDKPVPQPGAAEVLVRIDAIAV